jgi:hypothetical protein
MDVLALGPGGLPTSRSIVSVFHMLKGGCQPDWSAGTPFLVFVISEESSELMSIDLSCRVSPVRFEESAFIVDAA